MTLTLISHIIIALTSIAFSGLTFFLPSKAKLNISYGLVVATLASGTYLVVSTHSPILSSCVTGLMYLGVVTAGLVAAHHKLHSQN